MMFVLVAGGLEKKLAIGRNTQMKKRRLLSRKHTTGPMFGEKCLQGIF